MQGIVSARVNAIGSMLLMVLLVACSSTSSRYSQKHDTAPPLKLDHTRIRNAEPVPVQVKSAGNKSPYQINGKKYWVMSEKQARGYSQKGTASWYGTKFHGHKTSNGETYNMYRMSAAHKSLPIPCFVRVTNLDNGREAIVRVNDRGPFHGNRIIDLSYAAATKLGYADKGVARVSIEVIDPQRHQTAKRRQTQSSPKVASTPAPQRFLQAAAFSEKGSAEALRKQLLALVDVPVTITSLTNDSPVLHRVRIGPLPRVEDADRISAILMMQNLGTPHLVYD